MSAELSEVSGVRLAIEGCGHGTLHAIYASIEEGCRRQGWPGIDLLIIGGDFQAVRNAYDLNCVSMPAKYRHMGDFHEYYSGQRKAPYLTVFVGGNHEASNYLFELYYGGWVAPNIYYMGAANVLKVGPLRIVGMSGIWKGYNYRKPHYERLPYNDSDIKSIYHVRELDVRKLLQIRTQVDIGISHDWPNGVEWKGDWKKLFRFKPYFEQDSRNGHLGSTAAQQVLNWLRPKYWFSAHLHCKYAARLDHGNNSDEPKTRSNGNHNDTHAAEFVAGHENENEIDLDLDEDNEFTKQTETMLVAKPGNIDEIDLELDDDTHELIAESNKTGMDSKGSGARETVDLSIPSLSMEDARAALPEAFKRPAKNSPVQRAHPAQITNTVTDFLALDKCLSHKNFLQLLDVPSDSDVETTRPLKLEYDREWLAITRTFALDEHLVVGDPDAKIPELRSQTEYESAIDERRIWIDEHVSDAALTVPEDFEITAPVYDNGNWNLPQYSQVLEYPNPQTARFCQMLQIPNSFDISNSARNARLEAGPRPRSNADLFFKGRGGHNFRHEHDGGRGGGRSRGRGRGRGRGRVRG
jgi:lariat debranching enzyme